MTGMGLLAESATRLFEQGLSPEDLHRAASGDWLAALWSEIEAMGLPFALVPEEAGGFGVDPVEALGLVRVAAFHAAPVPLAETMVAAQLLALAGLPIPQGALTFLSADDDLSLVRAAGGWRLVGTARRVPWARHATAIAVAARADDQAFVACLAREACMVEPGTNVAGEPRDTMHIDITLDADSVAPAPAGFGPDALLPIGAGLRAIAIAGAMDQVLDLTVRYAGERIQFGRPIGKFQAIQQNLAVIAGQTAAAGAASDLAAETIAGNRDVLALACAKSRAGEAAGLVASLSHQIHGAIGFAHEHRLHHFTKRLWAWRDEFGSESAWNRTLGEVLAAGGAEGFWPATTGVGSAVRP